jgi:two-component system, response regulator YesN
MESVRLLLRNLCYLLIKLNLEFKNEIDCFLNKLNYPGHLLKYESIQALMAIVYNYYDLAVQKYLEATGGKTSIIAKVKNIIEKNYSSNIGLKELADMLHINSSYLTRVFKEQEGENINAYIIRLRIEKAKKILESGNVKIDKIAEAVGYEDSTYFFKVFKKMTGMTPREYFLSKKS